MNTEHTLIKRVPNRRQFLSTMTAMTAGAAGLMGCAGSQPSRLANQIGGRPLKKPSESKVYFRPGKDRFEIISEALKPLQTQVAEEIGNKQVIVKVNCGLVEPKYDYCSTHAEHLRAILEFLKPIYNRQIIVSEGTASVASTVLPAYDNYGYLPLEKQYNIKFIDANDQAH